VRVIWAGEHACFSYRKIPSTHSNLDRTVGTAAGVEKDFWTVGDLLEAVS
jgi:hypothetical protein